MSEIKELTYGQRAVGLNFNPDGAESVRIAKQGCADLIDQIHKIELSTNDPETKRMAAIAIDKLQTAQMWAVKVITWQ